MTERRRPTEPTGLPVVFPHDRARGPGRRGGRQQRRSLAHAETARGFTMSEILIALTVFAIGVLGSAGLLALAARTLERAEALDRTAAAAGEIGDSLSTGPLAGDGSRTLSRGDAAWIVRRERRVTRVGLLLRISGPGVVDSVSSLLILADSVPTLLGSWTADSVSSSWW